MHARFVFKKSLDVLIWAVGLSIAGIAAVGCDQRSEPTQVKSTSQRTEPPSPAPSSKPDATNTAQNARDRAGDTVTPIDQGENSSDIRITADVRKAIMEDTSLSTNARNIKIITSGGVVTLRGPVESKAEKESIDAKAKAVVGVTAVINELEIRTAAR